MSLLSTGTVRNDKVVFAQDFISRRYISDTYGIINLCSMPAGGGISPTSANGRIAYDRTQSMLVNSAQMTIRARIRMSANGGGPQYCKWISKYPAAANDNQFYFMIENTVGGGHRPYIVIAASAADSANFSYVNGLLVGGSENILHMVYDGTLAAGSRVKWYFEGLLGGSTVGGTIPTSMRAGGAKLSIFNSFDGTLEAPYSASGTSIFRDCRIWSVALSAEEVLDDARNRTFSP